MSHLALAPATANPPSGWTTARFKSIAALRTERRGSRDIPLLSLSAARGIENRESDGTARQAPSESLDNYWVVHPGDIVVNPMWVVEGGVAQSSSHGAVSPAYRVYRTRAGVHGRYLHHLLRSQPYLDQYRLATRGITTFDRSVGKDDFHVLPVLLPPLDEQRRIADFLDAETAHLDHLLELRSAQEAALSVRHDAVVGSLLDDSHRDDEVVRLKHTGARITVGIVVTPAAWYVDEGGVPAVRGTDVSPGSIRIDDLVQISAEGDRAHPKSRLRTGDVLVVRTGKAGAACAVPESLVGANAIDLLIIRPGRDLLPRYVEHIINSERTRRFVDEFSVGTIQSHFNVGTLGELPIPMLPLPRQAAIIETLDSLTSRQAALIEAIAVQRTRLLERRQALITAAVTGQLNVATVGVYA